MARLIIDMSSVRGKAIDKMKDSIGRYEGKVYIDFVNLQQYRDGHDWSVHRYSSSFASADYSGRITLSLSIQRLRNKNRRSKIWKKYGFHEKKILRRRGSRLYGLKHLEKQTPNGIKRIWILKIPKGIQICTYMIPKAKLTVDFGQWQALMAGMLLDQPTEFMRLQQG